MPALWFGDLTGNYDGLAHIEWCQVWEPSIGSGVATNGEKQQLLWGYPGVAWSAPAGASADSDYVGMVLNVGRLMTR